MCPQAHPSGSLTAFRRVIPSKRTLSRDFLTKLLPTKTLLTDSSPESQAEISWIWSESSDSDSDGTFYSMSDGSVGPNEELPLTESHSDFPSSGRDKYVDQVGHQPPTEESLNAIQSYSRRILHTTHSHTDQVCGEPSRIVLNKLQRDVLYCEASHQLSNSLGANHYFREKKWYFFPELSPYLQARDCMGPCNCLTKEQIKDSAFHDSADRFRWYSFRHARLAFARGAQHCIKFYACWKIERTKPEGIRQVHPGNDQQGFAGGAAGEPRSISWYV